MENKKEYEKAINLLSIEEKQKVALTGKNLVVGIFDYITNEGSISDIHKIKEEVRKDEAVIELKLKYKNGSSQKLRVLLVKQDNKWRVSQLF